MTAARRRDEILQALAGASGPVSAAALAARLGVSRQVVVGDVALLRAAGSPIVATPRGYVLGGGQEGSGVRCTGACRPRRRGWTAWTACWTSCIPWRTAGAACWM